MHKRTVMAIAAGVALVSCGSSDGGGDAGAGSPTALSGNWDVTFAGTAKDAGGTAFVTDTSITLTVPTEDEGTKLTFGQVDGLDCSVVIDQEVISIILAGQNQATGTATYRQQVGGPACSTNDGGYDTTLHTHVNSTFQLARKTTDPTGSFGVFGGTWALLSDQMTCNLSFVGQAISVSCTGTGDMPMYSVTGSGTSTQLSVTDSTGAQATATKQ